MQDILALNVLAACSVLLCKRRHKIVLVGMDGLVVIVLKDGSVPPVPQLAPEMELLILLLEFWVMALGKRFDSQHGV